MAIAEASLSMHSAGRPRPAGIGRNSYLPALAAMAYPFCLRAFHLIVGPPGVHATLPQIAGAALMLAAIFAIPALGLIYAAMPGQTAAFRRLGYASVAAPTAYVFLGVVQTLLGSPVPDELVWCVLWSAAALLAWRSRKATKSDPPPPAIGAWRVAHGIAGALISTFVIFHIVNHLFGLLGPEMHAGVMSAGRHVYRAPIIEPALVVAMLFQIASGLHLAWRWSQLPTDFHRVLQVGSGFYLSLFILGHMNSVFIYARSFLRVPTDWKFATGAPTGLVHDAWNIRLLPHYTLGVFFVLLHLCSGLRIVMIAHGVPRRAAGRVWTAGTVASAFIALSIVPGMCGVRIGLPA